MCVWRHVHVCVGCFGCVAILPRRLGCFGFVAHDLGFNRSVRSVCARVRVCTASLGTQTINSSMRASRLAIVVWRGTYCLNVMCNKVVAPIGRTGEKQTEVLLLFRRHRAYS